MSGDMLLVLIVGLIGVFVWMKARSKKAKARKRNDEEAEAYKTGVVQSFESGAVFRDRTSAPFKLKRNEEYIGSVEATLFLYKRDGYVAGHGLTYRLKLAKGLHYRIGGGRIGMSKSWQPDQRGVLHFTNDRIVFDGENKNLSVRWLRVIKLTCDIDEGGRQFLIDRETGPDWLFELDHRLGVEQMATILLVNGNHV